MIIASLLFYLFAAVCIASAVAVVTARNPIHSVLFLILAFFNAAGLFVLLGAEFLAMILVIVYVGAVAVLFLFVVMMLDVEALVIADTLKRHAIIGAGIGLFLVGELVLVATGWVASTGTGATVLAIPGNVTNTQALGALIYTYYIYPFQGCGLVLLVAMIGAIVLTLRRRPDAKRQDVATQVAKPRGVRLVKVPTGSGV